MSSQIIKPKSTKDEKFVAGQVVHFYEENPEEVRINSFKQIRESVKDLIKSDQFDYFIIKNNDKSVGVVQTSHENDTAEIILIYIQPEYRNEGIGSDALNQVTDKLEKSDAEIIKTEINIENNRSQNFFANIGFKKHSVIYIKDK